MSFQSEEKPLSMKKTCLAAFVLLGAAAYGLNWDNALIMGTTPGGKMFYAPGEEMVFTPGQ